MSRPTLQLAALKRVYIKSMMKVMGAKTPRQLVDIIIETTNTPRRAYVTQAMKDTIFLMTQDGATAAEIATELGISEPTVVARRRTLGLTKHRKKVLDIAPKPAIVGGVEGEVGRQEPVPPLIPA